MKRFQAIILLIAASAALAYDNITDYPDRPHFPDIPYPSDAAIIVGYLNCNSVLIYSGQINDTSFEWRGHNQISRFEIHRSNATHHKRAELRIRGGVEDDFLQVWSTEGAAINATVRIFSEPRNLTFGYRDDNSELVHSDRISGVAPLRFRYSGNATIRAIELWDQTNGTGAYIIVPTMEAADPAAVGEFVALLIGSRLFRGHIDFEVRVFAEPRSQPGPQPGGRNVELGKLLNSSVHIETVVLQTDDLSAMGLLSLPFDNYTLDFVRLTDLSNGAGGGIHLAEITEYGLYVLFDIDAGDITYLLEAYGRPTAGEQTAEPQDITVGELRPNSLLLEDIQVAEFGARVNVVRRLPLPIDRIEVRNAGSSERVRVQLMSGEVGGSLLVVLFETDGAAQLEAIRFTVRVWCSAR